MTSNLDFSEWGDVFPANRMLGGHHRPTAPRGLPAHPRRRELPRPEAPAGDPQKGRCETPENRPILTLFETPISVL